MVHDFHRIFYSLQVSVQSVLPTPCWGQPRIPYGGGCFATRNVHPEIGLTFGECRPPQRLHRSEDSGKPHMYEFYASHGSHGGHGAQIHLCYKSILPKYSQILPFSCRATVNTDCLAKTKLERSLSCPKAFKVHMMSCRCTGVCRRQSNESIVFSLES